MTLEEAICIVMTYREHADATRGLAYTYTERVAISEATEMVQRHGRDALMREIERHA